MKLTIAISLVLCLFYSPAYCADDYIKGEIAVTFKPDTKEEDAVNFINRFGLGIVKKGGFGPASLQLNVENGIDDLVNEIRREFIVNSALKGERLELNGREGTVIRVKFKQNAGQDKIEEMSLRYRNRKEVIGWRYYRSEPPTVVVRVPAGKERDWVEILRGPEYKNVVDSVMLVGLDI